MSATKAMNVREKVQSLQIKLYCAAKESLCRKFGALYDKIYRRDVLWMAWLKVKANKGVAGLDGKDFEYIEEEIGIANFMKEIQMELKEKRYVPSPVLRCWIDKPGKSEKRPLGIPTIKDRVVQMATKIVIEPIFETNFLDCSYGFRPKRSQHMAIDAIRKSITFDEQNVVIDADIKGYFNNIRHDILLKLVKKRINDPRVIKLIQGWLQAGILEDGSLTKANELGTPQGGVISPLRANIYLHSFDKMFEQSGIQGRLVRYCDDLLILLKRGGQKVLAKVRDMLKVLGLELHEEKTRVTTADKGFDFLGVHFRRKPTKKKFSKLSHSCRLWPSDKSMKSITEKLKKRIGRRYSLSAEEMVKELNPIIRGWNNYHTKLDYGIERQRILGLNYYVLNRFRIFLKRKYSDSTMGLRRVRDGLLNRLGMAQFG